jgi:hypothetical protein
MVGIWLATGLPLLAAFFAAQYVLYWHVFDMDITGLPNSADAAKAFMERYNRALHAVNVEMMNQQIPIQIVTFVYGILDAGLTYGAAAFAYRALVPAAPVAAAGTPSGDLRTT